MKKLLKTLSGDCLSPPPLWLMRQAGRYLPEYRAERTKAGSFLGLALNPAAAAEVTVQPIRRFGLDGAIIFSDILMVPYGLGQSLTFAEGEGPLMDPIRDGAALAKLSTASFSAILAPVYEALAKTKSQLPAETTLIGFAGAPFTVGAYMVEGRGKTGFPTYRRLMNEQPEFLKQVIDILTDATIDYLKNQIRAGAEVLQIFDSWSGLLTDGEFDAWSIAPTTKIVAGVKAEFPHIPIIGFPRGHTRNAARYRAETGVDAVQLDNDTNPAFAGELAQNGPVQGWLNPDVLRDGGPALTDAVRMMRNSMKGLPYVFNLGHGIHKETPPENVAKLVTALRDG